MLVPPQNKPTHEPAGLLAIARRHAGWLMGPAFTAVVLAVVGAFLWPDSFESTARVGYQSTADENDFEKNLNDRMQFALSRENLKTVIERNQLYPNDVKRLPVEDVVENMKSKIHFGLISRRDSNPTRVATFPVSFDYPDRFKAQKAVAALTASMVLSNLRATLAAVNLGGAEPPSKDAMEGTRKDLEESEALIGEFKEKNAESLPEQAKSNQDMLSSLRSGMARVQNQIAQTTREEAALQASLATEIEKRRNVKIYVNEPAAEGAENPQIAAYDTQIQALEEQIKTLKVQYTENFPDVKTARQKLEKIKTDRDALAKEDNARLASAKQRVDNEAAKAAAALDAEIKRAQVQIDARAAEADRLSKEAAEMDRSVLALQQKLEGSTDLEKRYAELLRERDINKGRYDEEEMLYQAKLKALGSTALAPMQLGSPHLEIVEPASLPLAPIEPNRAFIIGGGSLLGVVIGLAAAWIRELSQRSTRNLHEIYGTARGAHGGGSGWIPWTVFMVSGAGAMIAAVLHYYAGKT